MAPAGYGKTTLLSEWAACDGRPFAWISLDEQDNDPVHLLAHVACALEPSEPDRFDPLEALFEMQAGVLVLDDAHVLQEPAALVALNAIGKVLGAGSTLALASRSDLALHVARLRAQGDLVELRAGDLAMTMAEAGALFAAAGVGLDAADVSALAGRTEGWPAALSLAALSLSEQADLHAAAGRFGGSDRYVTDYLRDELLSDVSAEEIAFITRTSVLDSLTGPLCDAVVEGRGSAARLAALARSNLPLVPLDHSEDWYRYNGLLAEVLSSELRRLEPDQEAELHGRASAWYEANGDIDKAIEHAVRAHDAAGAGRLMWGDVPRYAGWRRNAAVRRWLAGFSDTEIASSPPLGLVAANSHLAAGNGTQADHWASAAADALERVPRSERDLSVQAGLAVLRASLARDGVARMGEDAARAHRLAPDGSPWRPICRLIEGVACHLAGNRDRARIHLEEGMRRAAVQSPDIHALCLAQLALLALDEDDWESGAWFAARAKALVRSSGLTEAPALALVFAVSAAVRAQRGQVEEAVADRRTAAGLLGALDNFVAWYDCEARIVLARAGLRLSDTDSARRLLAEASRLSRQVADAPVLRRWLDDALVQAGSEGSSLGGSWSLTTAELRVVQFLPSHLSFPEIAGRLYVSPNTVKTHVRSVYRKLEASSRGQAVERARHAGLLDLGA